MWSKESKIAALGTTENSGQSNREGWEGTAKEEVFVGLHRHSSARLSAVHKCLSTMCRAEQETRKADRGCVLCKYLVR